MSDMQLRRADRDLQRRMRNQEAKPLGPTLGEFYGQYQGLHRLRGLWPMASITETPTVIDASGQGRALSFGGTTVIAVYNDLIPYIDFNGTTGYLFRADEAGQDIVGTLTFGGWFWADSGATIAGLFSKWGNVAGNQAYALRYTGSNTVQLLVGDGAASDNVTSTVTFANDAWYFVVGRYAPSASISIYVNGTWTTNSTGIPAALVAGAAQLEIGRLNAVNGQYLNGRAGLCFLSADVLTDTFVDNLFARSRPLFGV